MPRIERSEQAERDLEEILDYLESHSPAAADRFARLFREATVRLATMPEMGRSREELATGLRSFTVGNHVLFYRTIDDGIQAIRVAHGSRDLPSLFDV